MESTLGSVRIVGLIATRIKHHPVCGWHGGVGEERGGNKGMYGGSDLALFSIYQSQQVRKRRKW